MKVCLASIHPRILSGQIEALVALRGQLEALGHDVHLVSAFSDSALQTDQRWAANSSDQEHLLGKLGAMGRTVRRTARIAAGCDVLHFNVPTPAFAAVADVVQMLCRRPMVVGFEAHLADVPSVARRLWSAAEFYLPRILINNGVVARGTLRRGRRWIVSSQFQARELESLGYAPDRIDIIPNLIDTGKLAKKDRAAARKDLGLPDGPLVAFVGHYHDVKGHDVLIDALPRIRKLVPETRLVLAWSGIGHEARVQQQVKRLRLGDDIIQLGRVAIADLFSAANVMALPYRFSIGQAAFPGTVLEVMSVGAPLVTSRLPLLAELITDESTGLLSGAGDPDELAQKVARLLADDALCTRMVDAQHQVMRTRFDQTAAATRYVHSYEQAIAGQARLLQPA